VYPVLYLVLLFIGWSLFYPLDQVGANMKRVLLLNTVLLATFFAAWCIWDYCAVKSAQYPRNCHDNEWMLVIIPLATAAANYYVQRRRGWRVALSTMIVATAAMCVVFLAAVLFPGIPFHLSIGGQL
jgi:hypothetical protein